MSDAPCGSVNTKLEWADSTTPDEWFMSCNNCHALGPDGIGQLVAIHEWNTRAPIRVKLPPRWDLDADGMSPEIEGYNGRAEKFYRCRDVHAMLKEKGIEGEL